MYMFLLSVCKISGRIGKNQFYQDYHIYIHEFSIKDCANNEYKYETVCRSPVQRMYNIDPLDCMFQSYGRELNRKINHI